MSSPAVTVGLSGCGAVAELYHAPALRLLEAEGMLRVAALWDPDPAALARVSALLPDAARATSYEELLEEAPRLAIIAGPPATHAEQVSAALEAGIAVFCEKPLATQLADAERLAALADKSGCLLAVGMIRRWFPATRLLRDLILDGAIGELRSFRGFEGGRFDWPVRSPGYFSKAQSGGGVLMDIGVHALDLLGWWFGECTRLSYADDAMGGVEADCRIDLAFGEVDCRLHLSRTWARPNRYEFQGTKGRMAWTVNEADRIELEISGSPYALDAALREGGRPAATFRQSFLEQLRCAALAAAGGSGEVVSGAQALAGLRLVDRCYRQRRRIAMGWLGEDEQRAAARLSGA